MAENIKTIKPNGGGDYTSLQSWEAALSADPTDDQVAECYEGSGGCFASGQYLTIDVSNTNNARIVIRAASGECFRDQSEWATSMYACIQQGAYMGSTTDGRQGIIFRTPNIHVEDMQCYNMNNGGHRIYGSEDITFQRCWLYGCNMQANEADVSVGATINLYNCIGTAGGTYAVWTRHADSVVNSINCIWAAAAGYGVEGGYMRSAGSFTTKNTWVVNHSLSGLKNFGGTGYSGNYNGSSDNSAPGANVQHDITMSDWFVSMTYSSFDFHLKEAKFGVFVGTDESGTIGTKDIDNQTRNQHDVGADATTQVTHMASLTEGGVSGEVVSVAAIFACGATEGGLSGDLAAPAAIFAPTVADGAVSGEAHASAILFQVSLSEGGSAGDEFSGVLAYPVEMPEGAISSESFSPAAIFVPAVAEGAVSGENESGSGVFSSGVSETSVAGDSLIVTSIFSGSLHEGGSTGESFSSGMSFFGTITDGGLSGEGISGGLVFEALLNEAGIAGDLVSGSGVYPKEIGEGSAAGEVLGASGIFSSGLTEGGAPGEGFFGCWIYSGEISEGGISGDLVYAEATYALGLGEGALAEDLFSAVAVFSGTLAEGGVAGETVTGFLQLGTYSTGIVDALSIGTALGSIEYYSLDALRIEVDEEV